MIKKMVNATNNSLLEARRIEILCWVGIVIIGFMMTLPLISAETYLGKQIQYQEMNLMLGCNYNGTICPISAVCNVTIKNPKMIPIVLNRQMGQDSYPLFNATIPKENLDVIGKYTLEQQCCLGGTCGTESFYFEINPSGEETNSALPFLLIGMAYFILILSFIFKNQILAILSGMALMILGVYFFNNGLVGARNLGTEIFSIFNIILGAIIALVVGLENIQDNELA